MEGGEGMVAVVRGLRDAGLAVTLLDGTKQYTLMPNAVCHHTSMPTHVHITRNSAPTQHCVASTDVSSKPAVRCDSAAQATDGRYASVYKMTHCNVTPTSPPMLVTEFPPQRAEVNPGHGNFEVGGAGSGDTRSPTRGNSTFRGGMSWPERGSVSIPRPSREPDAFASSLRHYPTVSPERSAEIVERLINYTQTKNNAKRSQTSPTRISETNSTNNLDRNSSRNSNISKPTQRVCEPEVTVKPTNRIDESPTRDGRPKRNFECDGVESKRTVFGKNYDVRYLRDVTKRYRESMRNISTYPYSHPVCPNIKERFDHIPPEQQKLPDLNSTNSVNMEIQAAVQMISREVATLPRSNPSRRHIAVPLSPTSSTADRKEGEQNPNPNAKPLFKSVQTTFSPIDLTAKLRKAIQTTSSSIELLSVGNECRCSEHGHRKSRSQEELKVSQDEVQEGIVHLLENLFFCDNDKANKMLRDELLQKYKRRIKEKVKVKSDGKIPILYQNYQYIHRESRNKTIQVYRAEVSPFRAANEQNKLDVVIRLWLKDVPIRKRDFLGRPIERQEVINTITCRLKNILIDGEEQYVLRTNIIELLEEVPIETGDCTKRVYLTGLANELLKKMNMHKFNGHGNQPRITVHNNNIHPNKKRGALKLKNYIQPTEEEMKQFVKEEFIEFLKKFQLKICSKLIAYLEIELVDVLIDSIEDLFSNNTSQIKQEIIILLLEIARLSEHQAMYFANVILEHLKEFVSVFHDSRMTGRLDRSQTFVVLQNTYQNASRQNETSDFSISGISEADIEANLNFYVQQLTQEINEWMTNLPGVNESDPGFRQVVVNDLAGDIVDRHKYLEMNPSKWVSDEAELEHLKCQIFKWINKLIGENAILDALEHASELFERVQNIPRPMLIRPHEQAPGFTIDTSMPPCCLGHSTPQSGRQSPSAQIATTPNRFSGNKPGFDVNKLPVFGPAGPGGSMTEAPRRNIFADRRQSSPGAYASRSMPHNTSNINSNMPIFGAAEPGGSIIDAPQRSTVSYRRLSGPGAIASGPMQTGANDSQIPVFGTVGPGVSMTEALNNKVQYRKLSGPAVISNEPIYTREKINVEKMPAFGPRGPGGSIDGWASQPSSSRRLSVPTYLGSTSHTPPSVEQLNAEYDNFVKNWVKEIPIPASKPQEQELADKARLGIYNGIWKTLAKLELEPSKLLNPFYCQDVLDDEVEDLLSCLPQTQELLNKKTYLKSKLVNKTGNTIELKVSAMAPENYKQQLVQNVTNNLPKRTKVDMQGEDHVKLYEDIEKLSLVEEFILYTRYKEENKVKAEMYRKRLANHIEKIVQNIKETHGMDLNKISPDIYINDVINALRKVPIPNDNILREEAEEILLGIEIERWLSDLPIVENNDFLEQISRRRLRYALAKKIRDMEKSMNLDDRSAESLLKQEITRFLQRLPMQTGDGINLEFIVEELVNRLKNRPKELDSTNENTVAFEHASYGTFVQNIPLTSSYADLVPEPSDRSSYMIRGGSRYKGDSYPYGGAQYVQMRPQNESSEEKWLTLEETRAPSGLFKDTEDISGPVSPAGPVMRTNTSQLTGSRGSQMAQNRSVQHSIQGQAEPPHVSFKVAGAVPLDPRAQSRIEDGVIETSMVRGGQPYKIVAHTEPAQRSLQARVEAMERQVASILPIRPSGSPQQQIGSSVVIEPSMIGLSQGMMQQDPKTQKRGSMIPFNGQPPQVGSYRAQQPSIAAPINAGQAIGNVEPPLVSIQAMVQAMDEARPANLSGETHGHQNQIGPCVGSGQSGVIPNVSAQAGPSCGAELCKSPNISQAGPFGGTRPYGQPEPCVTPRNVEVVSSPARTGPYVARNIAQTDASSYVGPCAVAPNIGRGGQPGEVATCVVPSIGQSGPSSGGVPCVVPDIGQSGLSGQVAPCVVPSTGQTVPYGGVAPWVVPDIGQVGPSSAVGPCAQPNIQASEQPIPRIQQRARGGILGTSQIAGPSTQKPCCGGQPNIPQLIPPLPGIREFRRPPILEISSSPSHIQEQSQRLAPLLQAPQGAVQLIREPNRSIHAPATTGDLSIMNQQPFGYSTPEPVTTQGTEGGPPRLARKRTRVGERPRSNAPRRRLDLEDSEDEMDIERDEVQSPFLRVQSHLFRADHLQREGHGRENINYLDINQRQFAIPKQLSENFKSIQTASSLMDIKYKARYCQELRSKSHEEVKLHRRDFMQEEVLEWWQMHRDKVKINKWGEKLKRLAEKIRRPGEEEKLRMKIVKYLERVPSQLSECDDDRKEFRERLPDNIIRKLKKYYHNGEDKRCPSPVKVFQLELPKYYYKRSINRHKTIIKNWLQTLTIKKKDFLGRIIKRHDILDYIIHKISPILISKPDSEIEYKYILKSKLMDIVQELPILTESTNKIRYLTKITDNLTNILLSDIGSCNYECNKNHTFDFISIRPSDISQNKNKFIKDFVADELINIVDESNIHISTKRMTSVETELTDILTDALDYIENYIDDSIRDEIRFVLQDIGKLTKSQAKHLSKKLFENFKEFHRNNQKYTQKNGLVNCLTNSTDTNPIEIFQSTINHTITENKGYVDLNQYEKLIIKEIDTGLKNTEVPLAKEKDFRDIAVKDLAGQIVNSCKNVTTKNETNSQECLKYQIFKWINKLVGKSNINDGYWKSQSESIDLIHDVAADWSQTLPLHLVQCPREQISLIGQMTMEIYKLIVHPEHSKSEDNEERIKSEILKYLRGFPLRNDRQSEHYLHEIVNDFWDILKFKNLYSNDETQLRNIPNKKASNSSSICNETNIVKQDIDYFNTNDYFEQLTHQIEEWLSDLHIIQVKEKSYRQVVVNDLAHDIIDRHKYMETNPSSRGTVEAELEHLKYLIFKRINKLVGEENLETIANASELMQKIRSMPVSIFTDVSKNITNENDITKKPMCEPTEPVEKRPDYISKPGTSRRYVKGGSVNEIMILNSNKVKQMAMFGTDDDNLTEKHHQVYRKLYNPLVFQLSPMAKKNTKMAMPMLAQAESGSGGPREQPRQMMEPKYSNGPCNPFETSRIVSRVSDVAEFTELEEGTTLSQIYEIYTIVLKNRCDEIPLATPTAEQESFVKITRQIIFNSIWKTFFKLKSDPEIENDYLCFEFMLEDQLDEMYDCLPETTDLQNYRQTWKANVVLDVMKMLKKIHCITDSSSFRRQVANKLERYMIRNDKQIWANDYHNYIVLSTADQYVAYKKYQESDPVKANIYKQRLMKHIEEMVRGYDLIKMPTTKLSELQQQCFLELEAVPIPGEDMLEEEVDEIMIGEEIEKWFNKLPLYGLEGETHILMRERLKQLLAKKIHEWEKRFDLDEPSIVRNMKHDMSAFLGRRGILQQDIDLNINVMVDELADRLRTRRQQKALLSYHSFERKKPLSSSLVPLNPNTALSHLIAAENERHPDKVGSGRQTLGPHALRQRSQVLFERSVQNEQPALPSSQLTGRRASLSGPYQPNTIINHAGPSNQNVIAYQRSCRTGKLGTSQMAGPSQATNPPIVLMQCEPGLYNQPLAHLPSDNIENVQQARPFSVQTETVEPSDIPQTLSIHGTAQSQETRSTARVMETGEPQLQGQRDVIDTEEERAEGRYRCQCRVRCKKRRYICACDKSDDHDDSRYINIPCRY